MSIFKLVSDVIISFGLLIIVVLNKIIPDNPLSLFLGFLIMYALLKFISYLPDAIMSPNWSTIEGKIVESKLVKSGGQRTGVYPDLRYLYVVDGIEYVSERLKIGVQNISSGRNWADSIVAKYPKNNTVLVYYNKYNPQNAVLEPGFNLRILIPLIPVVVLFIVLWFFEWIWQVWNSIY